LIFSDRGAWHGYSFDGAGGLEVISFVDDARRQLRFTQPIADVEAFDERLELTLEGGARARVSFVDARTARIDVPAGVAVQARGMAAPYRLRAEAGGVVLHELEHGPRGGVDLSGVPRTLRWNWRAPLEGITSGGAIPSPYAYTGFWAWDSWKHAAVLPEDLARSQIRAMFDHQRDDGMVPDTVMRNPRENNWRNSKPPLAAWACARHAGLLDEFRGQLERYHAWWEANRRPHGSRLFAYGGADLQASKWESGWDNATRYDEARLEDGLQTVLSVDLNAWMCLEKRLLGRRDRKLERLVDETFFFDDAMGDGKGGAYYDVTWPDLKPVRTLTAATWIPLWCGVASKARAEAVVRRMLDPDDFWTSLPFPTVARSDPRFDPDGYWRGAVWFDYALWGVEVLREHGREDEAAEATERLLAAPADYECYHPLTGEPAQGARPAVPQFSWTAAARFALER